MAPLSSTKAVKAQRARASIAHTPYRESSPDKENTTFHGTTAASPSRKATKRGLRSRSLGPGGVEALGEGSANPRKIQPLPRSILKPSVPISPPKPIPRLNTRTGALPAATRQSPGSIGRPQRGVDSKGDEKAPIEGADITSTRVSVKTEEDQAAAAREREREEIQRRREERRKSLANRRVSFAPEATLHTWDVVELAEDATSSSEATNSTRRASGSTLSASPFPEPQPNRRPESSPTNDRPEDIQVLDSPTGQLDSGHPAKRRSSGIPPMNFNDPQDLSSSPASSVGSDNTHQSFAAGEDDIVDESDTDEDRDLVEAEETITTVDGDDVTTNSVTSGNTESANSDSSTELDKALREATHRAGMHRMGLNEDPDRASVPVEGEASPSTPEPGVVPDIQQDEQQHHSTSEDEEMTMEVTQSIGGILPAAAPSGRSPTRRGQRKSHVSRPSNTDQESLAHFSEDETMELTTAVGGIKSASIPLAELPSTNLDDDEEMTMDFTAVVGGVVAAAKSAAAKTISSSRSPLKDDHDNSDLLMDDDNMDITMARGNILSPVTERTEPSQENPLGTSFTSAVSAILPGSLRAADKLQAKMIMEEEADHGQLTRSSLAAVGRDQKAKCDGVSMEAATSPDAGGLQHRQGKARRSSTMNPAFNQPVSPIRQTSPRYKTGTPTKQLTPNPKRPTAPSKTPPSKNVSMRKTSPKRLFRESKVHSSSPSRSPVNRGDFSVAGHQGLMILEPQIVLTPKSRRLSESRIDQAGMGSPRVAAILDRRDSIGNQAATFSIGEPGVGVVRFEDPRQLTKQLQNEQAEDARRESGRGVLQAEADSQTSNETEHTESLREIIGGLTPKKNKINGRKSLAPGAAKGLLGKRPLELDEDDEDATPKKLKGKDHSPVKSIFLPAPPSKDETTGRLGKVPQFKLTASVGASQTPTTQSPAAVSVSSPQSTGRFADTQVFKSAEEPPASFNEQLHGNPAIAGLVQDDEPIHLQDFLNMTNIRFMELTTTKRRHTVAPGKAVEPGGDDTIPRHGTEADPTDDRGLAACVVAGASTIPLLELYQHSCRELKKYISEGRSIVREIEKDTFDDNPPLFREYLAASPQVRAIMDNQFKNVKTNARLLSKKMWYEWRMKLLDGLKEGLERIQEGLDADDRILEEQEKILQAVVPDLMEEHAALKQDASTLQQQADAIARCNPEDLQNARNELLAVDSNIASTQKQIEELEMQFEQNKSNIEKLQSRKAGCITDIAEAERVREEFRGWSAAEVLAEKEKVVKLEAAKGWTITSAHEESIVLLYKSEVALYLTPASFKSLRASNRPNTTISLTYAAESSACTTTQRFFIQLLRARLLCIQQAQTRIQDVLEIVEKGWDLAIKVMEQTQALQTCWPTHETILSDETLQISSAVLLREHQSKIEASFDLTVSGIGTDVTVTVRPHAETVYGAELKEEKMASVLSSESGLGKEEGIVGTWSLAIETLEKKLNKFLAGKKS